MAKMRVYFDLSAVSIRPMAENGDRSEHDVLTSEPPDPYHLFLLLKDVRSLMVEDR
jgi:hypothetical protein